MAVSLVELFKAIESYRVEPVHPDVVDGRAAVPAAKESRRSGSSALPRDVPATDARESGSRAAAKNELSEGVRQFIRIAHPSAKGKGLS